MTSVSPDPRLHVDDLRWTLPPIDQPETINPLTLDDDELRDHVADLRVELRWMSRLLHEALTCIASQTAQIKRAMTTITELRRQADTRRPA